MAFGKTAEQREAEKQQKAAEKAAAEYAASPLGRAEAAHAAGHAWFQVEIPHATMSGGWWALNATGRATQTRHDGATDTIGEIEAAGWRLEHASWVYVQTGQNSRDKMLSSGQEVAISGEVVGIYLFRRA